MKLNKHPQAFQAVFYDLRNPDSLTDWCEKTKGYFKKKTGCNIDQLQVFSYTVWRIIPES